MQAPPVHNQQFVLGPRAVMPRADWRSLRLDDGLCLSHCPKLKVTSVADGRNRRWLLLGLAVQLDSDRPSPEEELRSNAREDVSAVYESWAGRWLLIGDRRIHPDAGGLLGCFYRLVLDEAGRQQLWASSSLTLLANLPGVENPPGKPRQLRYGNSRWLIEWDPPPRTGYPGIRKLLPTQTLGTDSGRVWLRPVCLRTPRAPPYDQVLDELADCLVTAMKNLQGRIRVALSAGMDSRLLLAAAQAARVPFSTYTQTFPTMLVADRKLPPLLSRLAGAEHVTVDPAEERQDLLQAFDTHCCGQSVDADRKFFARQQWTWTKPDDVLVRGLGFEIGMCRYYEQLPPDPLPADTLLRSFGAQDSMQYIQDSIAEYLHWAASTPIDGLDWRDRFYLEVRFAGWTSAMEQALDIVDGVKFNPANAARIFALLLGVPEEKRPTRVHHVDLIRRLSPELLKYPFNAPDGFLRTNQRRLQKYRTFLRERGFATVIDQASTAIRARLKRGK